jgi:hypothetical protein
LVSQRAVAEAKATVAVDSMASTGLFGFMKKLFVSCGPMQAQSDEAAVTAELAPTTKLTGLFVGWAEPGAPAPSEKLFVSWAEPSWAS